MKIKISKTKFATFLDYFFVVLISGIILSTLFFALPKTEDFLPENFLGEERFDLNTKEGSYWKEEFTIILDIDDESSKSRDIKTVENILYKRLRRAGAEEIQITKSEHYDDALKIIVQTTAEQTKIRNLISQRGHMELVVPKEDLEIDEDDFFQMYLRENYEGTGWTRAEFRNILIKTLLDSEGERSYFAIFKPWPQDQGKFSRFLENYEGGIIGWAVDDFVRPIGIDEFSKELFAVGLGPDPRQADFYDILLNTGDIPLEYTLIAEIQKKPDVIEIDYLQVTIAIIASMMVLTAYLYLSERQQQKKVFEFALSLLLTFSFSFTILKIYHIPVDLFVLIIVSILTIIYLKLICLRSTEIKTIIAFALTLAILMILLGTGYVPILGKYLLFVILSSTVIRRLVQIYFEKIKIIFT
jgi:hypothetical protein